MNKLATRFVLIATVSSFALLAQQGRMNRGGGTPPDPATMIQRRVDRLTTLLGLSSAQASQATSIYTNAHSSAAPLQTSMADARKSFQTAVKANDTAGITTAANNMGNLAGQLMAIHGKADAAFYATLTPEQRTKFDELGGSGMGMGMGFGPGGPGPMGGPGMRGPMRGRPGNQ